MTRRELVERSGERGASAPGGGIVANDIGRAKSQRLRGSLKNFDGQDIDRLGGSGLQPRHAVGAGRIQGGGVGQSRLHAEKIAWGRQHEIAQSVTVFDTGTDRDA